MRNGYGFQADATYYRADPGPETPGYIGTDTNGHPVFEPRAVYVIHEGGDTPPSVLCADCIADTMDPAQTQRDAIRRDDTLHCLGCDYHHPTCPVSCPSRTLADDYVTAGTPVMFTFDDGIPWSGIARGHQWNGFDNVAVTPDVAAAITRHFLLTADDEGSFRRSFDLPQPGPDGLVDLSGGYATTILRCGTSKGWEGEQHGPHDDGHDCWEDVVCEDGRYWFCTRCAFLVQVG